MKNREINFKDLAVEILLHWRGIFIAMVLGGILSGCLGYLRTNEQESQLTDAERQLVEWKENNLELANVKTAILYDQLYALENDYWNGSPIMQIDSMNVPTAEIILEICAEDEKNSQAIANIYSELITNTAFYNDIQEKCGIEGNVNQLISVMGMEQTENAKQHFLKVIVINSDKELCQTMAQEAIIYVQRLHSKIKENVGIHDIKVISQSMGIQTNPDILEKQQQVLSDMARNKQESVKIKNLFTQDDWNYYAALLNGEENPAIQVGEQQDEVENKTSLKTNAIYILGGIFAAIFSFVIVLYLRYISNSRLRITDDLHSLYGITPLGIVDGTEKEQKKKMFGAIDNAIIDLYYKNQRKSGVKEATELAVAETIMAVKNHNMTNVCLLGCSLSGNTLELCKAIEKELDKEGIKSQILNNVLYDSKEMEHLLNIEGAVLVETAQSTLYAEMLKELELLQRQNIIVLGAILVR